MDNYDIIHNDRNRFGGGVPMYVNKTLSYKIRTDLAVDNLQVKGLQNAGVPQNVGVASNCNNFC